MAELRSTTAIGGNIVWHGGNLRFDPQGETVLYNGHKVFTEHDTPLPSELGNGGTTSAYTKTESNANFAPIHAAGYVRKDGDAMTGKLTTSGNDIEIQGSSPRLTLLDWTDSKKWFVVGDGGNLTVREDTTSTTRVSIETNVVNLNVDNFNLRGKTAFRSYDSWLRINDTGEFTDGIYFGSSRVRTDGELYVGTTTTNGLYVTPNTFQFQGNRVFHEAYHPNADKWTTARTLTLSGDVSGSVSWDGSANASLSVTVANDSHTHDGRYYTETESDSRYVNVAGDTMTGDLKVAKSNGSLEVNSTANTNADLRLTEDSGNHGVILRYEGDANDWQLIRRNSNVDNVVMSGARESNNVFMNGSIYANANQRVFADNYHPNADKWTNARTLTLSGDASGSVVWDGSTNVTLTVAVANDSHTHDGRYYTESESDSRFAPINGAGYVAKSGDTMTGSILFSDADYKGIYFGTKNEAATGISGTWGFVRQGNTPGILEFGSDNEVSFIETDSYVKRIYMTLNDGTVNAVKFVGALQGNASTATSAAKWTTARTLTTTLTGDVTGSASMSVDGSGNKTVTVSTAVANDSHTHDTQYRRFKTLTPGSNHYFRIASVNGDDNHVQLLVSNTGDYGNSQVGTYLVSAGTRRGGYSLRVNELMETANDAPTFYYREVSTNNIEIWAKCSDYNVPISAQITGQDGSSLLMDSSTATAPSGLVAAVTYSHTGSFSVRDHIIEGGTQLSSKYLGISDDAVSAAKWTAARTLTLSGDASGSVSWDGSANATLSVTVANDSHSHDGRYYTETESNARYTYKAGDTMTGKLLIVHNVGSTSTYSTGQFEIQNSDAGDASMGFHRAGHTACQLRHESNGLILSGTTTTTAADFYCYGNVTAYSDIALKTDIEVIENPLEKVKQIRGITYTRTNDDNNEYGRQTGVIAQEVQAVLPEAVVEGKEHLSVAYGNLSGLLIESIKELNEKVETLQSEVHELKKPWWKKILGL